jgi:hypothetical protein
MYQRKVGPARISYIFQNKEIMKRMSFEIYLYIKKTAYLRHDWEIREIHIEFWLKARRKETAR